MSSVQNNQSNPLQNQNLTWTTVKQGTDTIYEGKNAQGKLMVSVYDYDSDEIIDKQEQYNDKGNKDKVLFFDDDSKVATIDYIEYDDKNREIKVATDSNADGKIDYILTSEYYNNGYNKTDIYTYLDSDGNKIGIDTYNFDEYGTHITSQYDRDADGKVDQININQYYDGELVSILRDENADGVVDGIEKIDNNKEIKKQRSFYRSFDKNKDGNVDLIKHYHSNGKLAQKEYDSDGDGQIDKTEYYDENGNLLGSGIWGKINSWFN